MRDIEWTSLFAARSKTEWIQKIQSDSKGTLPEEALIAELEGGVQMHALTTKEDLNKLPHLQSDSVYNRIRWRRQNGWHIGFPVLLRENIAQTLNLVRKVVSNGVERILVDLDHKAILITENQVNDLLTDWPAPETPIHFRLGAHLAHFIRSKWYASIPVNCAIELSRLRSSDTMIGLPALPSYEASVFDKPPIFRSIAVPVSSNRLDSTNSLGEALTAIHAYISISDNPAARLAYLLPRLQFVLYVGSNFYLEIAQFRALRFLMTRLTHEYLPEYQEEIDIPLIAELNAHIESTTSVADHLLQSTPRAIAGVLGGCSSLFIHPPPNLPDTDQNEAQRLTTNLQLMLRHEAHLGRVTDPAAGSYYIEVLTDRLIQSAWEYYERER